jgi:hypothetical protein
MADGRALNTATASATLGAGGRRPFQRFADWTPQFVLTPTLIATFVYV